MFLSNYLVVLLLIIINALLGFVVFVIPFVLSRKQSSYNKLTSYECGFNPFDDSRTEIDIKYYIVAILFIIFDLEISFLFPFISAINVITVIGLYSMIIFLVILTLGFVYE